MMDEYIRREAAKEFLCDFCIANELCTSTGDCFVMTRFKAIPAADVVEVRHGRFIGVNYDGYADGNPVYYEWICSQCGCVFEDDEPKMNYCPHCGAKMDGGPGNAE